MRHYLGTVLLISLVSLLFSFGPGERAWARTYYGSNVSFETDSDGDGIPDEWRPHNLGPLDKVVREPYVGDFSFRIVDEPGISKSLRQVIRLDLARGVLVTFGGTAKTNRWWLAEGLFALKTVFSYRDGSEETFVLEYPQRFDWQIRASQRVTRGRLQKIVVTLIYSDRPGKAWFDDIQVFSDP